VFFHKPGRGAVDVGQVCRIGHGVLEMEDGERQPKSLNEGAHHWR
jgi:hypothetical protein